MKRIWNFVGDEDDPFSPGTDLIVSLLAVLLVILVIAFTSYQDVSVKYQEVTDSLSTYKSQVEKLTSEIEEEKSRNWALSIKLLENASKESKFPPNIFIEAAEGYDFPTGSAELTDRLETYISNNLVRQIEINIRDFNVDTVVVIGHTDGQAVRKSVSNLDGLVEKVAAGNSSLKNLKAGSNTDLGLMRALAVVRKLQDIQKQQGKLKGLDPKKGYRAYSAGQLTLRNGEFAPLDSNPDKQRRRIEIRFTKSDLG